MLPPPDDVLAHGTSETEELLRWPSCAAPRVHIVHRGVVAQMKQLKVNFCAVELPRVVVRSLRNIQAARKELLPTTTNLPTAAALAFQIKLREISLNEIRVIRARLRIETDRAMSSLGKRRFRSTRQVCLLPLARKWGPPDLRRATNQRGHLQPKNTVCGPQVLS